MIINMRHPEYTELEDSWEKFRLTYASGQPFIDKYTKVFSKREDATEFAARLASTYCPAHAKTAVNEIKDAISERLIDVTRIDGPASYQIAIEGGAGGVDRLGSTMNGFVSNVILPELLSMGRVGVYVDRPELSDAPSKTETGAVIPYLYAYTAENILTWDFNDAGQLIALLLRDSVYTKDVATGLPKGKEDRYRFLQLTDAGVTVVLYDKSGKETSTTTLELTKIPFALFLIKESLLTDIANYQIALLNLGSSDLSYAIKSNFPFYTEQFDSRDIAMNMLQSTEGDGTAEVAQTAKTNEIKVGAAQGRRYPKGLERPGFIHPSSEPLTASMAKQKELQDEIRQLCRLAVKSLASSGSETKQEDNRSVESGLASIGAQMERGERAIGDAWADYEKGQAPLVKYPKNYTLRTDSERRDEASELEKHITQIPSITMQKVIAKQISEILVGHRVSRETLGTIYSEIDSAEVIVTDPDVVRSDLEAGLVGTALASKLRGYPEGEVELAKIDHAERMARIVKAQGGALNSARGVSDGAETSVDEKTVSRNTDEDSSTEPKIRGEGQ